VLYAAQRVPYANSVSALAPRAEIKVVPQPMGPYYSMLFTPNGSQNPDLADDDSSWGIIEVGQYTTDFAMIENGRTIEHALGSCRGMSAAAEGLQKLILSRHGITVSISEATRLLETAELKHFGKKINVTEEIKQAVTPLSAEIINKAKHLFATKLRLLDGICVAGGGAPLVHGALANEWPTTNLADNSRFSVAEGFCRFALGLEQYRAANRQGA
jgi:plasmid segregation protein ParM